MRVGRLGRPFQLDGALRLRAEPPLDSAVLEALGTLFIEGHGVAAVRAIGRSGATPVLYLEGVRDRDQAERLVNALVYAPAAAVPPPPLASLTGAPVRQGGAEVGRVVEVVLGGVNELLRVRTARGEVLLPLGAPYVRPAGDHVELVDAPDGLLEPA